MGFTEKATAKVFAEKPKAERMTFGGEIKKVYSGGSGTAVTPPSNDQPPGGALTKEPNPQETPLPPTTQGNTPAPPATAPIVGETPATEFYTNKKGITYGNLLPKGPGYVIYNNIGGKENWGTKGTLNSLGSIGQKWLAVSNTPIQFGDISKKGGGSFPPHATHQNGTDVDIRPMRKDGRTGSTSIHDPSYSRDKTRELIKLLLQDPNTKIILFNDPVLIREFKNNPGGVVIKSCEGHDNHLHVSFKK